VVADAVCRDVSVGTELDRKGREAGHLAVTTAKAGNQHVDQPAGGQKMRIRKQIARLSHRRPRDVAPLAAPGNLVLRQSGQHLLQGWDQPSTLRQPHDIGREAWIGGQFLQPEFLDKPGPLLVAGDPDEQLAVAGGFDRYSHR
jgi:hypothetical protein